MDPSEFTIQDSFRAFVVFGRIHVIKNAGRAPGPRDFAPGQDPASHAVKEAADLVLLDRQTGSNGNARAPPVYCAERLEAVGPCLGDGHRTLAPESLHAEPL